MKSYYIFLLIFFILTTTVLTLSLQAFADQPTVRVTITKNAFTNQTCVKNNNCFDPIIEQILSGQAIEWRNSDTISHTATSGKLSDAQSGTLFDSGIIKSGGTFDHVFNNVGMFDYFCKVHPWMTGVITVLASPNQVVATTNPSPILPVANAGLPQTVQSGITVALDGSNSSDPYNLPLSYSWTQTSGPKIVLSNSKIAKPTFTLSPVDSSTQLTFQLVVNDGVDSRPAITTITVQPSNGIPEFGVITPIVFLITIVSIIILTKVLHLPSPNR